LYDNYPVFETFVMKSLIGYYPCDAMHNCGICCQKVSVHLSVCPYIYFSVKTA